MFLGGASHHSFSPQVYFFFAHKRTRILVFLRTTSRSRPRALQTNKNNYRMPLGGVLFRHLTSDKPVAYGGLHSVIGTVDEDQPRNGQPKKSRKASNNRVLNVTLGLTILITVLQLAAALISKSLALLADSLSVSQIVYNGFLY
jgi:hypothetical protein